MTYRELARKLRALGCEFKRHSKGSHEIWVNPRTNQATVIPHHPGDIPKGTLRAILKQLGISLDEFTAAGQ
jgi:predicted RNA binding protein YcfA (HicA-like mRNA interferase family)